MTEQSPAKDVATIPFVGVSFDSHDLASMLNELRSRRPTDAYEFVATANADHIVRLHDPKGRHRSAFARAYSGAGWRLCDSRILARLARLRGLSIPVVTGSDLTARLFSEVIKAGDKIAVVGGDESIAAALRTKYPDLTFDFHIPPMGLADDFAAQRAAAAFIRNARPRFSFFAVGSPQQELLAALVRDEGNAVGTGLCIGAGISFLTGHSRRAPRWMQRAGLEWLDRLLSEPRRLWRRYLIEGPRVFRIAASKQAFVGTPKL